MTYVMKNENKDVFSCVPCNHVNCRAETEVYKGNDLQRNFLHELEEMAKGDKLGEAECNLLKKKLHEGIEERQCPDALSLFPLGAWRCDELPIPSLTIHGNGEGIRLLQNCDRVPKIILILESPHKAEYATRKCDHFADCCLYSTPAPVRGNTGKNVKTILPKIFDKRFDDYSVAFINIVQYQCSLGLDLKGDSLRLKNKIVWSLFDKYKENFVKRFTDVYWPDHDIVLICPTGGLKCRQKVYEVLRDNFDDLRCVLTTGHPSSWSLNCANRAISVLECTNMTAESISDITFCKANARQLYDALSGRMNNKSTVNGPISFNG